MLSSSVPSPSLILVKASTKYANRFHRAAREPGSVRLVADDLVDRFLVGAGVVRLLVTRLGGRGEGRGIGHVADARLVAGHRHHHQVGHHAMALRDDRRPRCRASGPGAVTANRVAGRDRLGLGQLQVDLPLEIAQAREVLLESCAVLGAHDPLELPRLVQHSRKYALARHHARRREALAFGSW